MCVITILHTLYIIMFTVIKGKMLELQRVTYNICDYCLAYSLYNNVHSDEKNKVNLLT